MKRSGRKRMDKEYVTMVWRDEDELRVGRRRRKGMEKHFRNKKDDLQTTKLKKGKGWKMCNDELNWKTPNKGEEIERYVMMNSPEKQERWFEETKLKKRRDGKIRRDELA